MRFDGLIRCLAVLAQAVMIMRTFAKLIDAVTVCLCVACCCAGGFAQTLTTARVAGTVRDVQGAAIVNAEVVAADAATGEKRTAVTDESGNYVLASLAPSTYQVTISARGFSTARYPSISAGIAGTMTVNAVLKIGGATSEITVTDAPPLVQSSNAEIATSLNTRTLALGLAPATLAIPPVRESIVIRRHNWRTVNAPRLRSSSLRSQPATYIYLARVCLPSPDLLARLGRL